jgi:predicted RNA-binding Zn ribbon-like protein
MARPAFRFGGRLALDLTWTVRFRFVAPTELLVEPEDLDGWLIAAGFTLETGTDRSPSSLRSRAAAPQQATVPDRSPRPSARPQGQGRSDRARLDLARALREAVDRSARRRIGGRPLVPADVDTINDAAGHAPPLPRLTTAGRVAVVTDGDPVRSSLAAVAHDAVDLLGTDQHGRLRLCEGAHCALTFADDSRPGRRRWCSVEVCGNRANTARYRSRRAL